MCSSDLDACDLRNYPRPLAADKKLIRAEGADVVFVPKTLYAKDASVFVEETDVSLGMEGKSRPGHFRGVATVVVKLFNLILPNLGVFGVIGKAVGKVVEVRWEGAVGVAPERPDRTWAGGCRPAGWRFSSPPGNNWGPWAHGPWAHGPMGPGAMGPGPWARAHGP